MTIPALATLCTAVLTAAATTSPPPAAPPAPSATTNSILDHAKALPPLPTADGVTKLPLTSKSPFPWRPIRDGITLRPGDNLTAAYTRTRGKPAGAALIVKPGTFTDLSDIHLTITGNRSQTLYLNLKQVDGSVWTLGPINVRTGDPRTVEFSADDIELDLYQNRGLSGATFDAASVYMVTLMDIAGHMSMAEPECEWTVSSFKAVRR